MGYGGKLAEQVRARELRAAGWTMPAIAAELGVARSSVSYWVRDMPYVRPPRTGANRGPNRLQQAKTAEIERLRAEGTATIGQLSDRELLVAGLALYIGEGAKKDGLVSFADSDPAIIAFYCAWFRYFFEPDHSRLRIRVYLHEDCDLNEANTFWSQLSDIPVTQFSAPHRVRVAATRRQRRHVYGCAHVRYSSAATHRKLMGLIEALLCLPIVLPG